MPRTLLLIVTLALTCWAREASATELHLLDRELSLHAPTLVPSTDDDVMPLIYAGLSVLLPGLGQTVSGRFQTGFLILGSYVLIAIGAKLLYDASISMNKPALKYVAYGAIGFDIGLYYWNVYDAYANANAGPESPYATPR